MAIPNDPNPNSLKVYIEAVQTVMPAIPTDPRISRQVSIEKSLRSSFFQARFHTILYYKSVSNDDSGWLVAGWMKESLAVSLSEQPILAARLRVVEEGDGDGGLELVPNDSGVRLVEARILVSLDEFLRLRKKGDAENEMVFWESIDEQEPQFSPLFYVQVTNFKCGGYSIGISCSLLLADPLVMTGFLQKWSNIHIKIVTKLETPKLPIFYLPNLGKPSSTAPLLNHPSPTKKSGQTFIYKVSQNNLVKENIEFQNAVAMFCMEETRRKLDTKIASKFYLIMKEASKDIVKAGSCVKQEKCSDLNGVTGSATTSWDEYLRAGGFTFSKGNKNAVSASYWINSPFDEEGLVIVIPSPDVGISAIVTIPGHNAF